MTSAHVFDGQRVANGNAVCPQCNSPFFRQPELHRTQTGPAICRTCWYDGQVTEAERYFRPLSEPLARELEILPTVAQTGGMIFCLEVAWKGHYAWFSTADCEFGASFGVYSTRDDANDWIGWFEDPSIEVDTRGYTNESGEAIARWAAPLILGMAAGKTVAELGGRPEGG